jgi:membrane-associated HD superfamily phosphohydrolase
MKKNSSKSSKAEKHPFRDWLHSSSSIWSLLIFGAFLIVLIVFFCVCTPIKYDLRVGSISHATIDAPKDVIDEVTTEEKRNAVAEQVEPAYRFQQGVKEEVLSSLDTAFQEMRTIQQYGLTLRDDDVKGSYSGRPFSEEEIAYALSLVNTLDLNRNQLTTLMSTNSTQSHTCCLRLVQRFFNVSIMILSLFHHGFHNRFS